MAVGNRESPPLPLDVRKQQQGPALQEYAQKAAAAKPAGAENPGQQASMQFVMQKLKSIANDMTDIAKVLSVEKPAVMPVLTRMAGMGKVLEQQVSEASQGQGAPMGPGSEPMQANAPEGPETLAM